jgi:hypothetical protein
MEFSAALKGGKVKKVYQVRVALVIDDEHRHRIIDQARRCYTQSGGASIVDDGGIEHSIPAAEAVQSIDDAVMELIQSHPAFDGKAIALTEMSCDSEETARPYEEHLDDDDGEATRGEVDACNVAEAEDEDGDLDACEADAYLCRWPNGDFSIVSAPTKRHAILELDEWAGAHPSQVYPLDSFKADFGLTDEGDIVLNEFGEETSNFIWDTCYPELSEVLFSDTVTDDGGNLRPGGRERVAEAVQHERKRLWENQPTDTPKTELGKRIARKMRTSATVADHYVEETAKRILESDEGEDGKPN